MNTITRFKPLFISHGSPTMIIDKNDPARKFLIDLGKTYKTKPKAIVVVSAHWEASNVQVTSSTKLIYDFYGFPKEMYEYKYNAPESPEIAKRIVELLSNSSIDCEYNPNRGIDHGTWVPLSLMFPDEDIPIVQVSLHNNLDMNYHINVGKALRPLLDDNILFIASGGSVHSFKAMRESNGKTDQWVLDFEDWLEKSLSKSEEERNKELINWEKHPYGRRAHPTEEHFIPIGVTAGISGGNVKKLGMYIVIPNFSLSFFEFDES